MTKPTKWHVRPAKTQAFFMQTAKTLIRLGADAILLVSSLGGSYTVKVVNEPRHDKTIKMRVRPAKTQIILGIHPV